MLDGQHASAFAASSHTHTWANILGETANSVNDWGGLRHQTNDGYIDFGPANGSHAHIYTDRPSFYFNKSLLVNNSVVWNAGNDGSGSGLDADLLDGLQGSQFLRSDADDTFTGSLTVTGLLTVGSSTASNIYMSDSDNGTRIIHNNSDRIGFLTQSAAWGSYCSDNGDWTTDFISYAGASMRAPIFYDNNNTGYYLDPASTSNLNAVSAASVTTPVVTATEIYANNWFRNNFSNEGMYNQETGQHWYSDHDDWWNVAGGTAANGIRFRDEHGGTIRGHVYADNSNSIGFLDSDANWAIRHVRDSRTEFYINNSEVAEINADYFQHNSDIRSPIFYDSDNTSYYSDPASTSRLNTTYTNNLDIFASPAYGVRFWGGTSNYSIRMSASTDATYGGRVGGETTSDYNMYFTMASGTNRGFVFNNGLANAIAGIDTSGNGRFEGDLIAFSASDKRLKDNIKPIENALDKVNKISGVEFDWNSNQDTYADGMHDIGVIAQEIEEVIPEVVKTRDNGYKAVKYEKIVPLLIEAIKEQQKQIDELKQLINKQ